MQAQKDLARHEIEELPFNYWMETSGFIEQKCKEYDGIPVSNKYAGTLLNEFESLELDSDGFHYTRIIRDEKYRKIIFGFRDAQFYELFISEIDNDYGMVDVASTKRELSGYYPDAVQRALFRVYHIDECFDNGLHEMTPYMHSLIVSAIEFLNAQPKDMTINSSLRHAHFLLENMPVIKLNRL